MTGTITIPGIAKSGELYPIEKLTAHRGGGVLHLAISVFVFSQGRLLIQQRASGKYHSGGLWANTCCTHPGWGEDLEAAAHRRLREELGFGVPELHQRAIIEYQAKVAEDLWERERVHIFEYATSDALERLQPAPGEVIATRLIEPEELRAEITLEPQRFAPWFRIYMERWEELNLTAS